MAGVEELIEETRAKYESLLAPINGGVGEDVSYDETFEAIKGEVDKIQAIDGGSVDWSAVVTNSEELLEDKSKDFRVALYFAAARAQQDGLKGLFEGIVLLHGLVGAFWDTMFPPTRRMRARANLFEWFAEIASPAVREFKPTDRDRALVMALDKMAQELDDTLREKMGDAYTGFGPVRDPLRGVVRDLPAEKPPTPPPPPPSAAPSGGAAPASAPSGASAPAQAVATVSTVEVAGEPFPTEFATPEDAIEAYDKISLSLSGVAETLRKADPGNAEAYRLGRISCWMVVPEEPENDGGVTEWLDPPEHLRDEIQGLMDRGDYLSALQAADAAANQFIYWLDATRYCSTAMDKLGALFIKAKRVLLFEVAALLRRVPGLVDLKFRASTPFADGATKMWIDSEITPLMGSGEGGGGGAAAAGSAADYIAAPLAEARSKVMGGEVDEGIGILTAAAAGAPSPLERFRVRLEIGKLALQAEQFSVARGLLEELERAVVHHHLDGWQPDLAASLYGALYEAHRGANTGEVTDAILEREQRVFERLCALDPAAAMRLQE